MPSKLSMDFNSLQTIGKNEQNKNKNLIIPAWISHVVYQAKLFQWHHRLKVKKNKLENPTIWILFFLKKSTYCSQGIQHSTYFMLPSLLSEVDLVRGAKIFPGIHPSAAGEWSLAGWYTRNMFCWLMASTWTTSPWLTQISFSFSA